MLRTSIAGLMIVMVSTAAMGDPKVRSLRNLSCDPGQIAKFDGTGWVCAQDVDTDTDTLAGLCAPGEFVRRDPGTGSWVCLDETEMRLALGVLKPIFVTSELYTGDLVSEANSLTPAPVPLFTDDQGLAAGDFICNHHAALAQLGGRYIAWLSDDSTNAIYRIGTTSGPFLRVDKMLVAQDIADLTNGDIANPINVDENGSAVSSSPVLTGTESDGQGHVAGTCNNWTQGPGEPECPSGEFVSRTNRLGQLGT